MIYTILFLLHLYLAIGALVASADVACRIRFNEKVSGNEAWLIGLMWPRVVFG